MSSLGLVLAGGAARGAYAAGVLRFLYAELPARLGWSPWPQVVSGTSVGALNGVQVATQSTSGILRTSEIWQQLTFEDVFTLDALSALGQLIRGPTPDRGFALLDARPLHRLVTRVFPRRALRERIETGRCRAFIVSTTELETGTNTLFLDTADPTLRLRERPTTQVVRAPIAPRHVLASAALPFLFPPVPLGERYHVDGALRQNTPLQPVVEAGCARVLVVGLRRSPSIARGHGTITPTLPFLVGKTLNALTLDPVERDVETVETINRIIDWGTRRHGPTFAAELAADLGLRVATPLFLQPSRDLGALAHEVLDDARRDASRSVRTLLSAVSDGDNPTQSDLLSYVLFHRAYTEVIEGLGFADAARREEEIAAFLTPLEPGATPR